jgi:hypothetical protein
MSSFLFFQSKQHSPHLIRFAGVRDILPSANISKFFGDHKLLRLNYLWIRKKN